MGDPKFPRKKYEKPIHPWERDRMEEESALLEKYGLKNKREIWKAESFLRNIRRQARILLGGEEKEREKEKLLNHLVRLGLLPPNSNLDDALSLTVESILSRRLQSIAYFRGLSSTSKQSRQFITHGHISVNGRKVRIPSYLVKKEEEESISYSPSSPLKEEEHPSRPTIEVKNE